MAAWLTIQGAVTAAQEAQVKNIDGRLLLTMDEGALIHLGVIDVACRASVVLLVPIFILACPLKFEL